MSEDQKSQNSTTKRAEAWQDLFLALFVLGVGIALMFTDAKALGGLIIGMWVGRYM